MGKRMMISPLGGNAHIEGPDCEGLCSPVEPEPEAPSEPKPPSVGDPADIFAAAGYPTGSAAPPREDEPRAHVSDIRTTESEDGTITTLHCPCGVVHVLDYVAARLRGEQGERIEVSRDMLNFLRTTQVRVDPQDSITLLILPKQDRT